MSRLIIIFLLVVVIVIFTMTYVLGAIRRFFVGSVSHRKKPTPEKTPKDEILYEKDNVRVLKGDAKKPERRHK